MAQMAAHGVRRQEQVLGHLPVAQALSYQPCDGQLGVRQSSPATKRATGRDQATAHAHGPQSPPYPASIPASSSPGVQHQGATERVYAAVRSAVIQGDATQIFQRRGKRQRSRALLEQLHRLSKILLAVIQEAGCLRRDGCQGPDIGVEL